MNRRQRASLLTASLLLFVGCAQSPDQTSADSPPLQPAAHQPSHPAPASQPSSPTEDPKQQRTDAIDGKVGELSLMMLLDREGRATLVFIDSDHPRYIRRKHGTDGDIWTEVDPRKLALSKAMVPAQKVLASEIMSELLQALLADKGQFFRHAEPFAGAALEQPQPGVVLVGERNGKLYKLNAIHAGMPVAQQIAVAETKKLLSKWSSIPSYRFSRQAPEQVFKQPELPRPR